MEVGSNPLPTPKVIALSQTFNGEGAAYRAVDGQIYAFNGVGPVGFMRAGAGSKKGKKKKSKKGKHTKTQESLNDGASGNLYSIDPSDGTILSVKRTF